MADRFQVISGEDAKRLKLPGVGIWTGDYSNILYDYSTNPPTYIASDKMEPEDISFYRDLAWVPLLLNELEDKNK